MSSDYRIIGDEATSGGVYSDVYDDAYSGPVDVPRLAVRLGRDIDEHAGASDLSHGIITTTIPADPQGGVHLRLWDLTHSTMLALLPEFGDINCSVEFNDDGNVQFNYPASAAGADVLLATKSGLIELREGNVLIEMGVYDQDADDPADQANEGRMVGVTAPGTLVLLNWAIVYPEKGFNTAQYATFQNVSPGSILVTLLARAQSRGTLDGIHGPKVQPSFDANFDSAGQPWPLDVWLRYDAGKSLREVAADLVDRGFIDTRMRGLVWDAYVKDTFMAADHPTSVLRLGRDVTATPRQRSRGDIRTALLVTGDANLSTEVHSPEMVATYGRREGYSGQSGVSVGAILQLVGQQVIQELDSEREGFTATYDRDAGGPQPFAHYDVGHFIRADWYVDPNTGVNLPVRVRTMSLTYDTDGVRTAEVELNDLFLERDIVLQRRVDALTNGSVSTATAPPTPVLADTSTPVPPQTVLVTSQIIVNADGRARAVAIISWPLVTSNDDATIFDDDGGYRVSWSVDNSDFTADVITQPGVGVAYAVGLPPRARFQARVAAADYNGHQSEYTISVPVTLAVDTIPPPPPSRPTVTPFIGSLTVHWDGFDNTGAVMPGDFDHVEAWVATANDPTQAVRMGSPLVAAGTIGIGGLPYGVPQFVWLRSVDQAGNPTGPPPTGFSLVADTAGTTPTQVLAPDLGGGAVGPNAFMYRDFDNKVPDGSFESAANRARLARDPVWPGGVWSFVQGGASDGGWTLQASGAVGAGTVRTLPLITAVEALANDKVWFTFKAKGSPGATGQAQLVLTIHDGTGNVISTQSLAVSTADGTWYTPAAGSTFTTTFPANAATYDVAVQLNAAAQAGTWSFDAVQVRQVIQTAVIDQAAIGNAQIQNLAVDEAQIQHVQVEDILAGTLQAPYIALGGGRLTTTGSGVQSGARVEMDSLGLRAYSSASVSATTGKTVEIKSDGTCQISGTIIGGGLVGGTVTGTVMQTSGGPGARVIIGPTPPDGVSDIGILIRGRETQNPPARITNYEYVTEGAADSNAALRITGGVANLTDPAETIDLIENAIFVFPRDQTDEQDATAWLNLALGTQVSGQGIAFMVAAHVSGGGWELGALSMKWHQGPNPYMVFGGGATTNDDGIALGFNEGGVFNEDLKVVNYAATAFRNLTAQNVTANGTLYSGDGIVHTSELRLKENVRYLPHDEDYPLLGLRPVTFDWRDRRGEQRQRTGFVYEDVEETHPHLTAKVHLSSVDGEVDEVGGWSGGEMLAATVHASQWLHRELDETKARVAELERAVAALGSAS